VITAVALVCLYANPTECATVPSSISYPTMEVCYQDRIGAEEALNNSLQGVAAYKCITWGEPT